VDQRYYKRKNTVEKRVIEKAAMRKKSHKLSDFLIGSRYEQTTFYVKVHLAFESIYTLVFPRRRPSSRPQTASISTLYNAQCTSACTKICSYTKKRGHHKLPNSNEHIITMFEKLLFNLPPGLKLFLSFGCCVNGSVLSAQCTHINNSQSMLFDIVSQT